LVASAANRRAFRVNAQSLEIELTKEDLAEIDRVFPPPKSKEPLPML
jgi:hypothetical protein